MQIDILTSGEAIGGLATAVGVIFGGVRHIILISKRKKEEYRQAILSEAKEEAEKIIKNLEFKLKTLEDEFQVQKDSTNKDFQHFKETYNAEVKTLGEKIESLREDLMQQHQALVGLLTRLVDSK